MLFAWSFLGGMPDIFFVALTAWPVPPCRTCVYPCLLFSSRKSTLNCDIFGHERDLGCVFESPFFKQKSTWDCTSHRGWSFVWGLLQQLRPAGHREFRLGGADLPSRIHEMARVKAQGLMDLDLPKKHISISQQRNGCSRAVRPWPPGPYCTSSSARYFYKTRQAKMRMKRSSFATNLVLLEKGWERMRKDEEGWERMRKDEKGWERMRKEGGGLPT